MFKKKILSFFSLLLLFVGVAVILTSNFTMTSATIGVILVPSLNFVFGLLLLLASSIVFLAGNSDADSLEAKIRDPLFVWDPKKRNVRIADCRDILSHELGHTIKSMPVGEVLKELDRFSGQGYKEILQEEFGKAGYFNEAYVQRDVNISLKEGGIGYYADIFLRKWDPNYRKFKPPTNDYLISPQNKDLVRFEHLAHYDARKILPVIEKNIPGFKVMHPMQSHDPKVKYYGAGFSIIGGSFHPYEIPKSNILRAIGRMAREDIKMKHIKENEQSLRMEVLRNYIFV